MADSVPSYCRRQGLSREKLFETNFLVKGRMPGDIRLGCAEKGEGDQIPRSRANQNDTRGAGFAAAADENMPNSFSTRIGQIVPREG